MKIENLWQKLVPIAKNLPTLKKDLAEGKVPELPYFIIDQKSAKESILKKIVDIDGERMQTNLVIAEYGNGKTNLAKYLSLFFELNNYGVDVVYSRADVDQPDLIMYLLKLIQDHYTTILITAIVKTRVNKDIIPQFVNNYQENFSAIKEYSELLFKDDNSEEQIKKLVYLGTGRLYSKANFTSLGLEQLNNFNRREILVLFLNILSSQGKYLIFAIDEVEKIREKSTLRFGQFLTTYRELVDLFNKIHGHYIITFLTLAQNADQIEAANAALYSRIERDIIELSSIEDRADILSLVTHLNDLFDTNKSTDDVSKITTQLYKRKYSGNRELLRLSAELLTTSTESLTVSELLLKYNLGSLFEKTSNELDVQGLFTSINRRFFDPLEYYLEDNNLLEDENQIDRQKNRSFVDKINRKIHLFLFNEQLDLIAFNRRIHELSKRFEMSFVIYAPITLELSNSSIRIEDTSSTIDFSIVDYDPKLLFVLLNMYRDYDEFRKPLGEIISSVTESNL
jgi:hypothetical protein